MTLTYMGKEGGRKKYTPPNKVEVNNIGHQMMHVNEIANIEMGGKRG